MSYETEGDAYPGVDYVALPGVDLLTVVMHEMGHLFGLPEASGPDDAHDVMWEVLGPSTRRLPATGDVLLLPGAVGQSLAPAPDQRIEAIIAVLFPDGLTGATPPVAVKRAGTAPHKTGRELAV